MDCQTLESNIDALLAEELDDNTAAGLRRHLHACNKCRKKYAAVLGEPTPSQIIAESLQLRRSDVAVYEGAEKLPEFFKPAEFKDAPVRFLLIADGREEEVKVVEPEMDIPIVEGARLVVKEKEKSWCDVRFSFNPSSHRPYELHFKVQMGISYAADHLVAFGTPPEEDKDLLNQYEMEILARDGVRSWIEMTQGKARLHIKYQYPIPTSFENR